MSKACLNLKIAWGKDKNMETLQKLFNELGTEALYLSHYDLEEITGKSSVLWRKFLTHPKVAEWIKEELTLLNEVTRQKMIRDLPDNQRSVGAAQILTAMDKAIDSAGGKSGPIFVYMGAPLTPDEELQMETVKKEVFKDET